MLTVRGAVFTVGGAVFTVGGACLQYEEHVDSRRSRVYSRRSS